VKFIMLYFYRKTHLAAICLSWWNLSKLKWGAVWTVSCL